MEEKPLLRIEIHTACLNRFFAFLGRVLKFLLVVILTVTTIFGVYGFIVYEPEPKHMLTIIED